MDIISHKKNKKTFTINIVHKVPSSLTSRVHHKKKLKIKKMLLSFISASLQMLPCESGPVKLFAPSAKPKQRATVSPFFLLWHFPLFPLLSFPSISRFFSLPLSSLSYCCYKSEGPFCSFTGTESH